MTRATHTHDHIPEIALAWHRAGQGRHLPPWWRPGARPRARPAASLPFPARRDGMGSVSGGCVEGAVVTEALEALAGRPAPNADLRRLGRHRLCRGPCLRRHDPRAGRTGGRGARPCPSESCWPTWSPPAPRPGEPVALPRPDCWHRACCIPGEDPATDARLRSDRSGMEEDGRFIAVHNPPLRLIVVGAVHIAQPLLIIARPAAMPR
jgi:xanthine dehydrogenase accessory factor